MTNLSVAAPLQLERLAVARALPQATVRHVGLGPERAARGVAGLDRGNPIAVAGVCGALLPAIEPGDVIVATEVRDESGTVAELPAAGILAAELRRMGCEVHLGPILATDEIVRGRTDRERLARSGALAVDMESAAILRAVGTDAPRAVLRVVSDTPARPLGGWRTAVDGSRALLGLRRAAAALQSWADACAPRTVLLAGPRSFCAGVERAIQIVEVALEQYGAPVYVRKQIVHNIHVVRDLERRGAIFVDEVDEVPDGATLVFSAHGVSPGVRTAADDAGLAVIDATCPLVSKVHAEARRFAERGDTIALIGHRGHEEVEGTTGEAPEAVRLVESVEDVDRLEVDDPERVSVLMQTTLAVDESTDILQRLRERFPALREPGSDDICYATTNRQAAIRAVAQDADLVLVVGSGNSSNSKRLVEISARESCDAYLVDDESDIEPGWLIGRRTVGVTAGASAPPSLVDRVVAALDAMGGVEVSERSVVTESVEFSLPNGLKPKEVGKR